MELTYLLKYLWKKKWVILAPTIFAFVLAWFFTRHEQQNYTSFAEISTGYISTNPLGENRNSNNTVLFNNVIQTLKSNRILDLVSYSLLLHDITGKSPFRTSGDKAAMDALLKKIPGGKAGLSVFLQHKIDSLYVLDLSKEVDRDIRKLADSYGYSPDAILGGIEIGQIPGSDFIRIQATTENPALSAYISNEICQRFLAYYQSMQGQASSTSLETLKSMVETKKQVLDNKLKMLQGGDDLAVTSSVSMLSNFQSQLLQQKNSLIAAKVALESINKQITAQGKQGGLANNEEIVTLKNNIDNLTAKYVNSGSNDANLLAQINKLRNDYQQKLSIAGGTTGGIPLSELTNRKMDLEIQANVAQQTINDLENKISGLQSTVQSSSSREGMMQGLQNEIEVARQEYVKASDLYNQALNRNIFPGNDFKQTLIANPPLNANPSKKYMVIGFAGCGVFFFVVFVLVFLEFLDRSIKTPVYLKENTRLPLMGAVQQIHIKKYPVEEIFSANGSLPKGENTFRNQVKQLRYQIETANAKIILVAGYHTGSGKTTLIRALATSLSLSNKKSLLVDANFRDNALTKRYNAQPSLETVLITGDKQADQKSVTQALTQTDDDKIQVIGCSEGSNTPDEVLGDKNLLTFLKTADDKFDHVFVDCAAMSQGPDAKELLRYCDAVILVFAADHTLAGGDRKMIDDIKTGRVKILGTILNKVNPENVHF